METCPDLEGWTDSEYKEFEFECDTDDDQEDGVVRGYSTDRYKKILFVEELLPE
tara:strand:+ start:330 stop:491 length:162 start_codon:yes stop_codon:yes gene_type:complete